MIHGKDEARVLCARWGFPPAAAVPWQDKTQVSPLLCRGGSAIKAQLPGGVSEVPGGDAVQHCGCKTNATVKVITVLSEDIHVYICKKEEHLNGPGWIYLIPFNQ